MDLANDQISEWPVILLEILTPERTSFPIILCISEKRLLCTSQQGSYGGVRMPSCQEISYFRGLRGEIFIIDSQFPTQRIWAVSRDPKFLVFVHTSRTIQQWRLASF